MKSKIYITLLITTIILAFSSCKIDNGANLGAFPVIEQVFDYSAAAQKLSTASGLSVTAELLEKVGEEAAEKLLADVDSGNYSELSWLNSTGYTYHVISDVISGNIGAENITNKGDNGLDYFDLSFVGDVLLDKNYAPMVHAKNKGGVINCIDSAIVDYMNASDVCLINNEFSIGDKGQPLPNKTWTFRAEPESLQVFKDLGADIVSLANNHVFDFGEENFTQTMANLKAAGLPYVGAGMNLGEAALGHYFIINGCKVGIVAASRAEKVYFTPVAQADKPGVMGTYESADFLEAIRSAKSQCDILVVYVHWGTENSTVLEEAQTTMAREYIDAGANAVVGGHTHCLQGMEFYKGAPIIYSVGNFWFNSKTLDSCVLTLRINKELKTEVLFLPLLQKGCETRLLTQPDERRALFDRVESYEPQGVKIDDEGRVTPAA